MRQVVVSRRAAIAALVLPALVVAAIAARSYQPLRAASPVTSRAGVSTIFLDGAVHDHIRLRRGVANAVGLDAGLDAGSSFQEASQARVVSASYASLVVLFLG